MKRDNQGTKFLIGIIAVILFLFFVASKNIFLFMFVMFFFPLIFLGFLFRIIKKSLSMQKEDNRFNNRKREKSDITKKTIKDIVSEDFHLSDLDSKKSNNIEKNYSYKDKPKEDYCDAGERAYELIEKENKVNQKKTANSDSNSGFEERLLKLEKEMKDMGKYNFSSDNIKNAVIYKEILDKKY